MRRAAKPSRGTTVRFAEPHDAPALEELGARAQERPPRGLVLVAEVRGAPWAAVSLDDWHNVAAPCPGAAEILFDLLATARAERRHARKTQQPRVWPAQPKPLNPPAGTRRPGDRANKH